MRMRDTEPLDLVRHGTEVIARSLFCTHMGCIVRWDGESNGFKCPCHGGAFDADGQPDAGPPLSSLRQLPVTIEGERVIVAPRPAPSSKS
jgi:Rieske Fe-S protein